MAVYVNRIWSDYIPPFYVCVITYPWPKLDDGSTNLVCKRWTIFRVRVDWKVDIFYIRALYCSATI